MPGSTLYRGETVFDDSNYRSLVGDGRRVWGGGEVRYLAREAPPVGMGFGGFAAPFSASNFPIIDKSDWDAMIDEQIEKKARVSDSIDFPAFDQDGLPTCWAICTAQCYSIFRRCLGLPHVQMSGCSLAVPISGGHRGGWEGDSMRMAIEQGIASTAVWPENNTQRSLHSNPDVAADRLRHKVKLWLEMNNDAEWATACLKKLPGVFAYNWMSHCMTTCDLVRIEAGSYGYRVRNTWRDSWGAKNELGFGGFAVYRMGRGTPDSGMIMSDITQSEK